MHRDPKPQDFVGKTIARVDTKAVNIWRFYFTDGTAVAIEVDAVAPMVYGMVVCDVCVKPPAPGVRKTHARAPGRKSERKPRNATPQEDHPAP